jgi:hypothetical protein
LIEGQNDIPPGATDTGAALEVGEPAQAELLSDLRDPSDDGILALFAEVMETGGAPAAIRDAIEATSIEELLAEAREVQRLIRQEA